MDGERAGEGTMRLRRTVRMASATVGVGAVALFALPSPAAYGLTRNVSPGQSIQAAVNAAQPGDTIHVAAGTYRQSVEITKSLTMVGDGQGATIIVPLTSPPTKQSPVCFNPSDPPSVHGMCIHGTFDSKGNVVTPVANVRVTGFTVKNFGG